MGKYKLSLKLKEKHTILCAAKKKKEEKKKIK